MKSFDRKFGREFVAALPTLPGVYRIFDAAGVLIYVGKAKNLRRRLGQYRNAKRRKKHLKMRTIVADAAQITIQTCESDLEACLLETRLIQDHRPRLNIASAFSFLYPMIGTQVVLGEVLFCYTTSPQLFPEFKFNGAYRSRYVTREAFFGLMELLNYFGHRIPKKKFQKEGGLARRDRFSYVYGFRQIPQPWVEALEKFWKGESRDAIEELILSLLENAGARKAKNEIQGYLNQISRFWRFEALQLARARKASGYEAYPVPQAERDFIFLKYRLKGTAVTVPSATSTSPRNTPRQSPLEA